MWIRIRNDAKIQGRNKKGWAGAGGGVSACGVALHAATENSNIVERSMHNSFFMNLFSFVFNSF